MAAGGASAGAADVAVAGLALGRGTLAGAGARRVHDIAALLGVVGLGLLWTGRFLVDLVAGYG